MMTACQIARPSEAKAYWSWRLIDGLQCWYEGRPGRDKATLYWQAKPQPEADQPELAPPPMPDADQALLESYWPDLDSLLPAFPVERWWPREIRVLDLSNIEPLPTAVGLRDEITVLMIALAVICLLWLALELWLRRASGMSAVVAGRDALGFPERRHGGPDPDVGARSVVAATRLIIPWHREGGALSGSKARRRRPGGLLRTQSYLIGRSAHADRRHGRG